MAIETSRTISVRKVCPKPGEGTSVRLKVIDQITFVDPKAQYQEYLFSFDNTPTADRQVRSEKVADTLDVERIEALSVIDDKSQYQESLFSFLYYQEGVHLKTHKTKVYALNQDGTKDKGVWVEVERVDQISFIDPKSQYQEYIYELNWPDLMDPEWDYQDLFPVITDYDSSSINPPWRLDPFQNIVDASFGLDYVIVEYHWATDADLDIRLRMRSPVSVTLGWAEANTAGDFGTWGGDNTGQIPSAESVAFDMKKARAYKSDLVMELGAYWYVPQSPEDTNASTSPVVIKITSVSGGSVFLDDNLWTPSGATSTKTETAITASISAYRNDYEGVLDAPDWPGQLIGTLTISPSGKWKLT